MTFGWRTAFITYKRVQERDARSWHAILHDMKWRSPCFLHSLLFVFGPFGWTGGAISTQEKVP